MVAGANRSPARKGGFAGFEYRPGGGLVPIDKKVYICFLVMVMMAASPVSAAEPGAGTARLVVRVDRRTGRLIRASAQPSAPPASTARANAAVAPLVAGAARRHGVDPLLVDSVIQVESAYNPYALSPKGAQGLMQLMPATARMLGVNNSFDPRQNIEAGVRYLKQLKTLYGDDRLALAAYNAGPGAVAKYGRVPPYSETRYYVDEVTRRYQGAQKAAQEAAAAGSPEPGARSRDVPLPAVTVEERHPKLEQFVDAQGRLHLSTKRE
jgi:hypothetical protein